MKRTASVLLLAATVVGCTGGYAGQSYTPVVDVYNSGRDPNLYAADLQYCQMLAEQESQVRSGAMGAGVGALTGAGLGAIGGSIHGGGNVAEGAALGALAGVLGGALYGGQQANVNRQGIVMSCLSGRGWVVVGR